MTRWNRIAWRYAKANERLEDRDERRRARIRKRCEARDEQDRSRYEGVPTSLVAFRCARRALARYMALEVALGLAALALTAACRFDPGMAILIALVAATVMLGAPSRTRMLPRDAMGKLEARARAGDGAAKHALYKLRQGELTRFG